MEDPACLPPPRTIQTPISQMDVILTYTTIPLPPPHSSSSIKHLYSSKDNLLLLTDLGALRLFGLSQASPSNEFSSDSTLKCGFFNENRSAFFAVCEKHIRKWPCNGVLDEETCLTLPAKHVIALGGGVELGRMWIGDERAEAFVWDGKWIPCGKVFEDFRDGVVDAMDVRMGTVVALCNRQVWVAKIAGEKNSEAIRKATTALLDGNEKSDATIKVWPNLKEKFYATTRGVTPALPNENGKFDASMKFEFVGKIALPELKKESKSVTQRLKGLFGKSSMNVVKSKAFIRISPDERLALVLLNGLLLVVDLMNSKRIVSTRDGVKHVCWFHSEALCLVDSTSVNVRIALVENLDVDVLAMTEDVILADTVVALCEEEATHNVTILVKLPEIDSVMQIASLSKCTPYELLQSLLDRNDFAGAVKFATKRKINMDSIYKKQWEATPVSSSSIDELLSNVCDSLWVISQCSHRIPADEVSARRLIQYGQNRAFAESLPITIFENIEEKLDAYALCRLGGEFDPLVFRRFRDSTPQEAAAYLACRGRVNELLVLCLKTIYATGKVDLAYVAGLVLETTSPMEYADLLDCDLFAADAMWFANRARDIDNKSGLLQYSLQMIEFGLKRFPQDVGLLTIKFDTAHLIRLVYRCGVDELIRLETWEKLSVLEKIEMCAANASANEILELLINRVLPMYAGSIPAQAAPWLRAYREYSMRRPEVAQTVLLDSPPELVFRNRIDGRLAILEFAAGFVSPVDEYMMRSFFARLPAAGDTVENVMPKKFFPLRAVLKNIRVELDSVHILQKHGIPVQSLNEVREAVASKDAEGLISKLLEKGRKQPRTQLQWINFIEQDLIPLSKALKCNNESDPACHAELSSIRAKILQEMILSSSAQQQQQQVENGSPAKPTSTSPVNMWVSSLEEIRSASLKWLQEGKISEADVGLAFAGACKELFVQDSLTRAKDVLAHIPSPGSRADVGVRRIEGLIRAVELLRNDCDELTKQEVVPLSILLDCEKDPMVLLNSLLDYYPALTFVISEDLTLPGTAALRLASYLGVATDDLNKVRLHTVELLVQSKHWFQAKRIVDALIETGDDETVWRACRVLATNANTADVSTTTLDYYRMLALVRIPATFANESVGNLTNLLDDWSRTRSAAASASILDDSTLINGLDDTMKYWRRTCAASLIAAKVVAAGALHEGLEGDWARLEHLNPTTEQGIRAALLSLQSALSTNHKSIVQSLCSDVRFDVGDFVAQNPGVPRHFGANIIAWSAALQQFTSRKPAVSSSAHIDARFFKNDLGYRLQVLQKACLQSTDESLFRETLDFCKSNEEESFSHAGYQINMEFFLLFNRSLICSFGNGSPKLDALKPFASSKHFDYALKRLQEDWVRLPSSALSVALGVLELICPSAADAAAPKDTRDFEEIANVLKDRRRKLEELMTRALAFPQLDLHRLGVGFPVVTLDTLKFTLPQDTPPSFRDDALAHCTQAMASIAEPLKFAKSASDCSSANPKLRPSEILEAFLVFALLGCSVMAGSADSEDDSYMQSASKKVYDNRCKFLVSKLVPTDAVAFAMQTAYASTHVGAETRRAVAHDALAAVRAYKLKIGNSAEVSSGFAADEQKNKAESELARLESFYSFVDQVDDERIKSVFESRILNKNVWPTTASQVLLELTVAHASCLTPDALEAVCRAGKFTLTEVVVRIFLSESIESERVVLNNLNLTTTCPDLSSRLESMVVAAKTQPESLRLLERMVDFGLASTDRLLQSKAINLAMKIAPRGTREEVFRGFSEEDWLKFLEELDSGNSSSLDFAAFKLWRLFWKDGSNASVRAAKICVDLLLKMLDSDVVGACSTLTFDALRAEEVLRLLKGWFERNEVLAWEIGLLPNFCKIAQSMLEGRVLNDATETEPHFPELFVLRYGVKFLHRQALRSLDVVVTPAILRINSNRFQMSVARFAAELVVNCKDGTRALDVVRTHRRSMVFSLEEMCRAYLSRYFLDVAKAIDNGSSNLIFASEEERLAAVQFLSGVVAPLCDVVPFSFVVTAPARIKAVVKKLNKPVGLEEAAKPVAAKSVAKTPIETAQGEWAWDEEEEAQSTTKAIWDDDLDTDFGTNVDMKNASVMNAISALTAPTAVSLRLSGVGSKWDDELDLDSPWDHETTGLVDAVVEPFAVAHVVSSSPPVESLKWDKDEVVLHSTPVFVAVDGGDSETDVLRQAWDDDLEASAPAVESGPLSVDAGVSEVEPGMLRANPKEVLDVSASFEFEQTPIESAVEDVPFRRDAFRGDDLEASEPVMKSGLLSADRRILVDEPGMLVADPEEVMDVPTPYEFEHALMDSAAGDMLSGRNALWDDAIEMSAPKIEPGPMSIEAEVLDTSAPVEQVLVESSVEARANELESSAPEVKPGPMAIESEVFGAPAPFEFEQAPLISTLEALTVSDIQSVKNDVARSGHDELDLPASIGESNLTVVCENDPVTENEELGDTSPPMESMDEPSPGSETRDYPSPPVLPPRVKYEELGDTPPPLESMHEFSSGFEICNSSFPTVLPLKNLADESFNQLTLAEPFVPSAVPLVVDRRVDWEVIDESVPKGGPFVVHELDVDVVVHDGEAILTQTIKEELREPLADGEFKLIAKKEESKSRTIHASSDFFEALAGAIPAPVAPKLAVAKLPKNTLAKPALLETALATNDFFGSLASSNADSGDFFGSFAGPSAKPVEAKPVEAKPVEAKPKAVKVEQVVATKSSKKEATARFVAAAPSDDFFASFTVAAPSKADVRAAPSTQTGGVGEETMSRSKTVPEVGSDAAAPVVSKKKGLGGKRIDTIL